MSGHGEEGRESWSKKQLQEAKQQLKHRATQKAAHESRVAHVRQRRVEVATRWRDASVRTPSSFRLDLPSTIVSRGPPRGEVGSHKPSSLASRLKPNCAKPFQQAERPSIGGKAQDAEAREWARTERVRKLRQAQRTEAEARLQRLVTPSLRPAIRNS